MKAKGVKEAKEEKEDEEGETLVPPRHKLSGQLASRPSIGGNLPINPALSAHIPREYAVVVDRDRKYVLVSDSFCKLLGYRREELIGRKYDDVTTPGTNDIPTVSRLLHNEGYMHGIWVFAHRKGTRILVRYEAWVRPDGLTECNMDLLGAGA